MQNAAKYLAVPAMLFAFAAGAPAARAADDPAIGTITSFDNALIETMKAADSLGVKGRFKKLEPAVERTFDLGAMTRFAVGPAWLQFSDADKKALVDAFTRLTVASYAHNFDGYSGQHFEVTPAVDTRGIDKVVQTHLVQPNSAPVTLSYRMRQSGGSWKVIDVFYNGTISQLTTRRADLSSTAGSGGAAALLAKLNSQTAKLMQ
jgi:phospholipid transport system substrate-binding protein